MPFVKLDCGILRSTLWFDKVGRDVFLAALLMAEPREFLEPQRQLKIRSNEETGWEVPEGWYGFVPASGIGIAHSALVDVEKGLDALERFGESEADSRSPEFDGRRLVRVSGGFIVLNYMRYRDRDSTAAERQRRLRERKRSDRDAVTVTPSQGRNITHSRVQSTEADTEADPDLDPSVSSGVESVGVEALRAPAPPAILTFPISGKGGAWHLSQTLVDTHVKAFPGLDVKQEYRKALAWAMSNPGKRKTSRGMPAFLYRWLEREQNRGGGVRGRPAPDSSGWEVQR